MCSALQIGQSGRFFIRAVSSDQKVLSKLLMSTKNYFHNDAVTRGEPSVSESDKNLHYNDTEGYYKSSPYVPIIPLNIPLDKYIWEDLKKWEKNTATECIVTGRQYSYAELRDASATFAVRLQTKFKLGKGDVLAICLPNLPDYACVVLGAIEAGLTVTTMNPVYTAKEISRQLTLSQAKFMVCTAADYPIIKKACNLAKSHIPICCVRTKTENVLPEDAIDFFKFIEKGDVDFSQLKDNDISGEDIVLLPFSSGTMGLPKGVMLTHNNITGSFEQFQDRIPLDSSDTVPVVVPFFHAYGLVTVMLSKLGLGAKLVTLPQFRPDDFIKSLNEYRASILHLAPPIVLFMLNSPEVNMDTAPNIRLVTCGAAPIGSLDIERFRKKFPNTKFGQGYGLTETSVVTYGDGDNAPYASVGVLLGNTEAKIVPIQDEDKSGQGPNIVGELCVRGPQIMPGYLNNEEANKEIFYPGRWLRTGDAAYYDKNGFFYITDRIKELIKVKGFQVAPAELEAILRDHPKIIEAAVFGIPHEKSGEVPRALVVLKKGETATKEEIYNYVAERVAHYKKLEGGIVFADEVPKNPAGKIMRQVLREKYAS